MEFNTTYRIYSLEVQTNTPTICRPLTDKIMREYSLTDVDNTTPLQDGVNIQSEVEAELQMEETRQTRTEVNESNGTSTQGQNRSILLRLSQRLQFYLLSDGAGSEGAFVVRVIYEMTITSLSTHLKRVLADNSYSAFKHLKLNMNKDLLYLKIKMAALSLSHSS
ncbi:uncharacterized protein LOC111455200 isoform X2 [Cucurbita moschata]|uniref:Uncharacterized protein LOC111455200 isoform X2 n=1 Tax=Cucurbita moschata TaxID=3662 RepID=A0A6J1GKW6_CUCMO|nr:uncharacterized protein LOC111455200 isoform X2 [Cucurbita moschata]